MFYVFLVCIPIMATTMQACIVSRIVLKDKDHQVKTRPDNRECTRQHPGRTHPGLHL